MRKAVYLKTIIITFTIITVLMLYSSCKKENTQTILNIPFSHIYYTDSIKYSQKTIASLRYEDSVDVLKYYANIILLPTHKVGDNIVGYGDELIYNNVSVKSGNSFYGGDNINIGDNIINKPYTSYANSYIFEDILLNNGSYSVKDFKIYNKKNELIYDLYTVYDINYYYSYPQDSLSVKESSPGILKMYFPINIESGWQQQHPLGIYF